MESVHNIKLYPDATIGETIRKIREMSGLSQKDLAEKADISQQHLSKIESDNSDPAFKTIERIAEALNIGVSKLTGYYDTSLTLKVEGDISKQGGVGIASGPVTINLQSDIPTNEEREAMRKHIAALEQHIAVLNKQIILLEQK